MKKKLYKPIILLSIAIVYNVFAQADYSSPKDVAQGFLDLCLAGKRFEACKLYGTEGCSDQISTLIKQLVTKDIPLISKTCKYLVDSCKIDQSGNNAKCFYRKSCKDVKKNKKGFLTLKKIEDEWRVEYLWMKDKYL
jgi:hypothetical protein